MSEEATRNTSVSAIDNRGFSRGLVNFGSRMNADESSILRPDFGQGQNPLSKYLRKYLSYSATALQNDIVKHLEHTLGCDRDLVTKKAFYQATCLAVRDRMMEIWNDTQSRFFQSNEKRVYLLSAQYEPGKMLKNALWNLQLEASARQALLSLDSDLGEIYDQEEEISLSSGALGKFASCFLDAMATQDLPGFSYGVRYSFGDFKQNFVNEEQVEFPNLWAGSRIPWEILRPEIKYKVNFYGTVKEEKYYQEKKGIWENTETVYAEAYDTLVPGYDTFHALNLRTWKSLADLEHLKTIEGAEKQRQYRTRAEEITMQLNPSSKELQLKQQYLLVAGTIADILYKFKKNNEDIKDLPKKVAIQLNDTHPALAIIELLRILYDEEDIEDMIGSRIATEVFSYTCHSINYQEQLFYDVDLLGKVLPRHLSLIYELNLIWTNFLRKKYDDEMVSNMSLIEESNPKRVRMFYIAALFSHKIVGVSHKATDFQTSNLFKNFYALFPERFITIPFGISPRRWINVSNRDLSECYTEHLSNSGWITDGSMIQKLKTDIQPDFLNTISKIKNKMKRELAKFIQKQQNISISESSLFDVHVKLVTDHRRQLMYCFYVIHRYLQVKKHFNSDYTRFKRTFIIGGRAHPDHATAKSTVHLAKMIAKLVNSDPEISKYIQMVYISNLNKSVDELTSAAADVVEQITCPGTESSDYASFSAMMNAAVLLGSNDSSNYEASLHIDKNSLVLFGCNIDDVAKERERMKSLPSDIYFPQSLKDVIGAIQEGLFGNPNDFTYLLDSICKQNDRFLIGADFNSYIEAQKKIDDSFVNKALWKKMMVESALGASYFYSDRTVLEYAEKVWKVSKRTSNVQQVDR